MLTTKAEMGTKMFWISTFLCNDFTNSSTQYTILHITQIHVFMTCHHWIAAKTVIEIEQIVRKMTQFKAEFAEFAELIFLLKFR